MMLAPDKSQKEFDEYLRFINGKDFCKYHEPFVGITTFCNSHFSCRFRSKVPLRHRGSERHECNRQNVMKIKRILG